MRTITVTTDRFQQLGRLQAAALGERDLPLIVIPHPLAGIGPDAARERGRAVARQVLSIVDGMP